MRRRRALLIFLPPALLLLAAGVYLFRQPLLVRPVREKIQQEIQERVAEETGATAEIQEVSGNVITSLKLSAVEVLDLVSLPPGSSVRFESLEVGYSAAGLALGRPGWLRQVDVVRPEMVIDLRTERRAPALADPEDEDEARAIRVPVLRLERGDVILRLPDMEISLLGVDVRLETGEPGFRGEVHARQVRLRSGERTRALADVTFSLDGDSDGVRLADLASPDLPYRLDASVDLRSLDARSFPFTLSGEGGSEASGKLDLGGERPSYEARIRMADVEAGPLIGLGLGEEGWSGRLGLEATVTGEGSDIAGKARIEGTLIPPGSERSILAEGDVTLRDGAVVIEESRLQVGDAVAVATGRVDRGGVADIAWSLDAEDVEALAGPWLPGLRGPAKGEGSLRGPVSAPVVEGSVDGRLELEGRVPPSEVRGRFTTSDRRLRLHGATVHHGDDRLAVDGEIRLAGGLAFSGDVEGHVASVAAWWRRLREDEPPVDGHLSLRGHIDGPLEAPAGSISVDLLDGAVAGMPVDSARGIVRLETGRVRLERLVARLAGGRGLVEMDARADLLGEGRVDLAIERLLGRWDRLRGVGRAPLVARIDGERVVAEGWVLDTVSGEVRLDGRRDEDGTLHGTCEIPALDIGGVMALLETPDPPKGRAHIRLQLDGPPGSPTVQASADLADLEWRGLPGGGGRVRARYEASTGALHIDELHLGGAAGGILDISGRLPLRGEAPVRLRLEARALDLEAIRAVLPSVRLPQGRLDAQVVATGPRDDPYLSGFVRLEDGAARFPRPFPAIDDARGRLTLGGRRHRIDLEAKVGGEAMTVRGEALLARLSPSSIDVAVRGENVLLADSRDLRVRSAVDLRITGEEGDFLVSGKVRIGRSRYYRDFSAGAATTPGGAVAGEAPDGEIDAGPDPWERVRLDIEIDSGRQVWVDNREMLARYTLEGEVKGTLASPRLRASVRSIEGIYKDYGRKFRIDSMLVDFDEEDVRNPRIDVYATTRISATRIFLRIHGRTESLTLDLASDPPYPESDILSLLALGYTRAGAAESGFSVALTRAFDFIFGAVGELFRGRDREISTVDRVDVEGLGQAQAGTGGVRLIYRLSDRVSAEAERDVYGHYNVDVFYRIPF